MARRDPRRGGGRRRNAKRAAMQRIQGRGAQTVQPGRPQAIRQDDSGASRKRPTQDNEAKSGIAGRPKGGPASDFQPGGRFGRPQGGDAVASGPGLQDLLKRQQAPNPLDAGRPDRRGGQAHTPESRARLDQDLAAFKGRQSQQPPRPPQRATPPGRVMDVMPRAIDGSGSPNDLRVREMLRQRMSQPPPSQEDRLARQQGQQIGRTAVMPPPVRAPGQTIQMGGPVQPRPGGLGQSPTDMHNQRMQQQREMLARMNAQPGGQPGAPPPPQTPPRPPLGTNQLVGNALARPGPTTQLPLARPGPTTQLPGQLPGGQPQPAISGLIDQPRQPIAERRLETQGQPRNEMVNDTSRRAQDEQRRKLLEEQKRKRMSGGLPFQRVGNFRPPQASNRAGPGNASYRMR